MLTIKWKKTRPDAILPTSAYDLAGAFDLYIPAEEVPKTIYAGNRMVFDLGLACEFHWDYMMHFATRSGAGKNMGLTIVNVPTIIDPDYRGELSVVLLNTGHVNAHINPGTAYIQAWLAPRYSYRHLEVGELSPTRRGAQGFGSSSRPKS